MLHKSSKEKSLVFRNICFWRQIFLFSGRRRGRGWEEEERNGRNLLFPSLLPLYGNCPFHPTTRWYAYAKKRGEKEEDTIAIDELTPPLRRVRERDGKHRCPTFLFFSIEEEEEDKCTFYSRLFFPPGKCVSRPAGLFCVRSIVEIRGGAGRANMMHSLLCNTYTACLGLHIQFIH